MGVGGRLESQVCLVEGVHLWTMDGWRPDGRGLASLLSAETDSKHANIQKLRNVVNEQFTHKIISHNDLCTTERVGGGGGGGEGKHDHRKI